MPMDLSNVKSLLRAVVQSCKEGVLLSRLSGDYRVTTGEHIPFKAFGYNSLEEFLRSIPDTVRVGRNATGEITVFAVADESTAHLEKLIARQKTSRKKTFRKPTKMSRSLSYQTHSSYSRMPPRTKHSTPFKMNPPSFQQHFTPNRAPMPQRTVSNNRSGLAISVPNNQLSLLPPPPNALPLVRPESIVRPLMSLLPTPVCRPPFYVVPTANMFQEPQQPPFRIVPIPPLMSLPNWYQYASIASPIINRSQPPPTLTKPGAPPPRQTAKKQEDDKIRFSEKFDVPPRFKKLVNSGQASGGKEVPEPEVQKVPEKVSAIRADKDYKSMLNTYCSKQRLGNLGTMITTLETNGGYVSHVKVKGETYGSLSIVKSRRDAEQLAAKNACESLEITDAVFETRKTPKRTKPVKTGKGPNMQGMVLGLGEDDDDEVEELAKSVSKFVVDTPEDEIKTRVRDLIATKPNGMWNARLPVVYKEKYKEPLPCNYPDLLKQWTDIILIEEVVGANRQIYYPVSQSNTRMVSSDVASRAFENVAVPPVKMLKAGDKLRVYMCHVLHCNEFYVQLADSCIDRIMKHIEEIYEARASPKEISRIEDKAYCVARYTGDHKWYRGQIISTRISGKFEDEGEVLYVDFGNTEFLPKSFMRRMLSSIATEPVQAIKCSLHGILPNERSWSSSCIQEFCNLVQDQILTMEVLDVNDDTCDVMISTDMLCINEVLVEKGLAKQRLLEPDPLKIPDDIQHLDVYVSFITMTTDVVVRLVGPEYSDLLEEVETEMEIFYSRRSQLPSFDIRSGALYALVTETEEGISVSRVRAIQVNGDKVDVSCVDHGDRDTVHKNQLRNLDNKFRKLPYQAVTCNLSGLEEFNKNEAVLDKLCEDLLGKTVVAEIVDRSDRLSVILYDTSSSEDVNQNEMLAAMVADQDLEPHLPDGEVLKEVFVTHIDTNGLFHLQIPGPGLQRLEVMMNEIEAHFSKKIGADEFVPNPERNEIVCCKFTADQRWYRAKVLQVLPERMVEVHYVDYGNSDVVEISQLRSRVKASEHITTLPHQSVQCTLYNLPPPGKVWTEDTVAGLSKAVNFESFVPVKTIVPATEDSPAQCVMFLLNENDGNTEFIPLDEQLLEFGDDLESEVNAVFDDLDDIPLDETAEAVYSAGSGSPEEVESETSGTAVGDTESKLSDETINASQIAVHEWLTLDQTGVENETLPNDPSELNNNDNKADKLENISAIAQVDDTGKMNGACSLSNSNSGSVDSLQFSKRTRSITSEVSFDSLCEPLSARTLKYYHKIPIPSKVDIPRVGSYFDVHITWVCDPSNFACAPFESQSDLQDLMKEMHNAYTYKYQPTNMTTFHVGQMYAAFYENLWYRVMIRAVLNESQMVSAQFVDYGDFTMLPFNVLQPLPGSFRELPLQAVRAQLSGIVPADGKAWSKACEERLKELIVEQDLVALIRDNETESEKGVKVKLVDTSNEANDVCIDEVLVKEGYAKFVQS